MVKKHAGGSSLEKAATCPPELIGAGHVSKWGVAKLHLKEKLVRAAGRLSRGSSFVSDEPPTTYADDKPVVLVGPVIGLVTESKARILLEVDRDARVEMSLQKLELPYEEGSFSDSFMAGVSQRLCRGASSPAWLCSAHLEETASVAMESAGANENSGHSQEDSSTHSCDDAGSSVSSKVRRKKSSRLSMQTATSGSLMSTALLRKLSADSGNSTSLEKGSSAEYELSRDVSTTSEEFSMETTEERAMKDSAPTLRRRRTRSLARLWRGSSLSPKKSPLSKQGMHYLAQGGVNDGTPWIIAKQMVARRPCIFEFVTLEPGSRYKVEVKGCNYAEHSIFKTLPNEPMQSFSMASISCNSIFITKKTITPIDDLWSHLYKCIRSNKINLLIHLGDQIYGDGDRNLDAGAGKDLNKWSNRFKIAQQMLKGLPEDEWVSKQDDICEKYREVYRDTWKHPSTAKCLANCPSLMIYDDHEIRDNWGDNPLDRRKDCMEFFIARCAWMVVLEYQRQLYKDVDFSKLEAIKEDHHLHVIGKIGLMFLDIRGSRTFHREEDDPTPYLGSRQWKEIEQALSAGGLFDKVKLLVVCSPAPLVFLVPAVTFAAHNIVDRLEDFKGHWSSYKLEQKQMIGCLHQWKASRPGREVIVLGGDVHCGGHSCIMKKKETLFYQLTTSPIANMPLPKTVYYPMRFAEQLEHIPEGFRFRHFNWTRARNYGLVHVNFHGREGGCEQPEIIMQLVRGKFLRPVRMGKRVSNLEEYTCTACSALSPVQWCKARMFKAASKTCEKTLFLSGSSRKHGSIEKDK